MPQTAGLPSGYREGGSWSLPQKTGELASTVEIGGAGAVAPLNLAGGLNAACELAGSGALSAEAQLIVSAVAALSGLGSLSPSIAGKLDASITLAGSGAISGALAALAGAVAEIVGSGTLTATGRGQGFISADIQPFTELSPQSLAAAVWNALVADFDAVGTFGEAVQAGGGGGGPSAAAIADAVWDKSTSAHTSAATFGGLVQGTIYTAKLAVFDDDGADVDRYVVTWFANGAPVTSGITLPSIRVVRVADGTDLVPSSTMTEIASGLSRYRYDATTTQRIVSGAAYIALLSATIDGATRTWDQPVGRDSTA